MPPYRGNLFAMTNVYQTLRLGGEHRNAESLGDFIAWLIANDLLDPALEERAGREAARVKMQDLTGPAFLTTVLDGELRPEHLNAEGRKFCEYYLTPGDYDRDYQQLEFEAENDWRRYDVVSSRISEVYRNFNKLGGEPASESRAPLRKLVAKVIPFPKRR